MSAGEHTWACDIQGRQGGLTDLLETIRTWASRSHGFLQLVVCHLLKSEEGHAWLNHSQNLHEPQCGLDHSLVLVLKVPQRLLSSVAHKPRECGRGQLGVRGHQMGKWSPWGSHSPLAHHYCLVFMSQMNEPYISFQTCLPAFSWGMGHKSLLNMQNIILI